MAISSITNPELVAGLAAEDLRSAIRFRMSSNACTIASGLSTLKNSPRELIAACQRSYTLLDEPDAAGGQFCVPLSKAS
ncbi:hypothetical protein D3C77_685830 [compost metagenome]